MVVVVFPTPPVWFAIAIIRGVGYGPVGVVPGMFMMSQEYRHIQTFGGMAFWNVPRGTFWAWVAWSVVNVPRGTLQRGQFGWVQRRPTLEGLFLANDRGSLVVVQRPQ